ncbi:Lrp/AsnC family transcriptional regulator [Paenibacillus solisilvae]|uniref:Lrp/AsnC family transcriptional regulator n=1 Tax=Paenibacillus solisilvae TaxID=2486751 RepID=A0ABW0VV31_9BACL
MSNVQIDDIDMKIISMLHENGRISYTDLAKEVGLSRVAIQSRVNALMDNNIIERFTVVINAENIGMAVSAFLNVEVEPQYLQQIAEKLANDPYMTAVYHMTGPSKLHMHAVFANNQEMEKFLREKLYVLPGIMSVDCQLLITRYKNQMGINI